MTPEEEQYFVQLAQQLDSQRIQNTQLANDYSKISAFQPVRDPNLIEYQLDLKDVLDRMYHLLSGHVLQLDKKGNEIWVDPSDDRLKILSDYGVKQLMNIISFYLNPNTILSHYQDDHVIMWKVRDFGIELADLIFTRYEVFFSYPSPEELYERYLPIMIQKNIAASEYELYQKCVQWSKEELQQKIRHYPIIVLSIVDTVHSTYLRALHGETRKGLTTQTHVMQNVQPQIQMVPQKPGLIGKMLGRGQ